MTDIPESSPGQGPPPPPPWGYGQPSASGFTTRYGLVRPRNGRIFAGVCAGLGRRFGISANVVRLIFLLSCLLPGPQFLIYLAIWVMVPNEERHPAHV